MNTDFFIHYINPAILGCCLCTGFALKHAKLFRRFKNQYIPLIMLVLGTAINLIINIGNINIETVLEGMISGLASTGLYEAIRNLGNHNSRNLHNE